MPSWFSSLFGFEEASPEIVRENLILKGTRLESRANGKSFECGTFEMPELTELRDRVVGAGGMAGAIRVAEVVGDAAALHADPANAGASFQVASQFNMLEMVAPEVTPEQGIAIYVRDRTQGPACAIACAAGTVCRNYLVPVNGQTGQTATVQLDGSAGIGAALGNGDGSLWDMQNGYLMPKPGGLPRVASALSAMTPAQLDALRGKLKIGIHSNTQVTLSDCSHGVTQMYCSALPVSYCDYPDSEWTQFARLVLDAAYEATFSAAIVNAAQTGNRLLYLTLLGGGAFGNEPDWILSAIGRSLDLFRSYALDVRIVSHRHSKPQVQQLLNRFQQIQR